MIEKRINNDCYLVYDNAVKYVGKARTLDYDDNHQAHDGRAALLQEVEPHSSA